MEEKEEELVWQVIDGLGETYAIFSTEALARIWLEATTRCDIAGGFYGRDIKELAADMELTWREGKLGFVKTSSWPHMVGRPAEWDQVDLKIMKAELDPAPPDLLAT